MQAGMMWVAPRSCALGVLGVIVAACAVTPTKPDSPRQPARAKETWTIRLLDLDLVAGESLDANEVSDWIDRVRDAVEPHRVAAEHHLAIQVELRAHDSARVQVMGVPALDADETRDLTRVVANTQPPRSRLLDIALRLLATNENLAPPAKDFGAALGSPRDAYFQAFSQASRKDRARLLQAFARERVLPVTAQIARGVNAEFVGVRGVGARLAELDPSQPGVGQALMHEPLFWRGLVEMARGNTLIAAAPVYLLLAEGNFDYAAQLGRALRPFVSKDVAVNALFDEAMILLDILDRSAREEVRRGVELFDGGDPKAAAQVFEKLLDELPRSSAARYELAFTRMSSNATSFDEVDRTVKAILVDQPMWGTTVLATTGRAAYELVRRAELTELFGDPDAVLKDLRTYADIALELENFPMAAYVYWQLGTFQGFADDAGKQRLARFAYAVERSGGADLLEAFTTITPKDLEAVAAAVRARMESDAAYKAVRAKGPVFGAPPAPPRKR